jgi:hypothetical protein
MYQVDDKDRVVPLDKIPQSSAGAPLPLILAGEHRTVLAYYLENRDPLWDGKTIRVQDPAVGDEPVALAVFNRCLAHMFGPPNDEAFKGHPLASRGLTPYCVFRIEGSSWIRQIERMNSVHHAHRPERFWELQHLIFAFHDSTFECICRSFDIKIMRGAVLLMVPEMVALLELPNS